MTIGVTLAFLLLCAFAAVWLSLPLLPAWRELFAKTDAAPLRVERSAETDVHHSAHGFHEYIRTHLDRELSRCREEGEIVTGTLHDGTDFLVVPGTNGQQSRAFGWHTQAQATMVLSCGDLHLPPRTRYPLELYARASVRGAWQCTYRAILAGGDISLGWRSTVVRWMHAAGSIWVAENSRLCGRISADQAIDLAGGCSFERLHAPCITFGPGVRRAQPLATTRSLDPHDLHQDVEVEGRRWWINKSVDLPAHRRIQADLVVTGDVRVGEGAQILGSLKGHGDLHLERGVTVQGSVVGARNVYLAEGCSIQGPLIAEGTVSMESGCAIGDPARPTTVNARRIKVARGVEVHGTVWAHEEGRVRPAADKGTAVAGDARQERKGQPLEL